MPVMPVVTFPNPVLRTESTTVEKVDEHIVILLQGLRDTCDAYNAEGIAAVQVGIPLRMFVSKVDGEYVSFVNPVVTDPFGVVKSKEGCLSLPGVNELVDRHEELTITALNEEGEEFSLSLEGRAAVAVQHEYDHMDGVLLIDRVSPMVRRMIKKKVIKTKRKHGIV